jgi:hypothetical protein
MMINSQQREAIRRCKRSVKFFLRNFGKIKHASAGLLPFKPWPYQEDALDVFCNNRFVIFKKNRQAGISKISGAFALWFAMFFNNKKILIVSRKDDDAKSFLRDNVLFILDNLPEWMRALWKPTRINEHEVFLPNGSVIQSLTSAPDVLRSHSSSLNIIDEAAFIPQMDQLWAAGAPTLIHGGRVIVISTTNGTGNWYWSTWVDAEAKLNQFYPFIINWWDMDWNIEYKDPVSGQKSRIAPRDGIRDCVGKDEINKYGPYWSPWLEEQYRQLQERGEPWKFDQEILANFVGSGNTVLDKAVLAHLQTTTVDPEQIITGSKVYVHPVTGESEDMNFSFPDQEGLWIWEPPVVAIPPRKINGELVEPGQQAHDYVMGVDTATGKGRDYHTIEILDTTALEQAAEFMVRCLPRELIKYIDRIGRYYNCALAVIERNNGGDIIIDELRYQYMYPRIWRKKEINDKPQPAGGRSGRKRARPMKVSHYGFMTSASSKQIINKHLINCVRDDGSGYTFYSRRLLKQLHTYVRKRDRSGRDTNVTEAEDGANNFDDLVMGLGLALVGANDSFMTDVTNLMPLNSSTDFRSMEGPVKYTTAEKVASQEELYVKGGPSLMLPLMPSEGDASDIAIQRQLDRFSSQLGGVPVIDNRPAVVDPKFFFKRSK